MKQFHYFEIVDVDKNVVMVNPKRICFVTARLEGTFIKLVNGEIYTAEHYHNVRRLIHEAMKDDGNFHTESDLVEFNEN